MLLCTDPNLADLILPNLFYGLYCADFMLRILCCEFY